MTSNPKTKILILGISGMLGSTLFQYLRSSKNLEVFGSLRSKDHKNLPTLVSLNFFLGLDIIIQLYMRVFPTVIVY